MAYRETIKKFALGGMGRDDIIEHVLTATGEDALTDDEITAFARRCLAQAADQIMGEIESSTLKAALRPREGLSADERAERRRAQDRLRQTQVPVGEATRRNPEQRKTKPMEKLTRAEWEARLAYANKQVRKAERALGSRVEQVEQFRAIIALLDEYGADTLAEINDWAEKLSRRQAERPDESVA